MLPAMPDVSSIRQPEVSILIFDFFLAELIDRNFLASLDRPPNYGRNDLHKRY